MPQLGSRAALVVVMAGLFTVFASFWTWGTCPTTPCGGVLQAISWYSGVDLGFGIVTAVAGLGLIGLGLASVRTQDPVRLAPIATVLALVIVVSAAASVVWMYVLPGEDKAFYWPPSTAVLVAIAGLLAVGASLRLRGWRPRPR